MGWGNNPVVYLYRQMWRFSEGNRKNVVFFSLLFVFSQAIDFFEPLVVALLLNTIQEQGIHAGNIWNLIAILSLFLILELAFVIMFGPARFIEISNSFLVRANYKKFLMDGILGLDAKWHSEHKSGDTIDRVEKATTALRDYSESTFQIIETIVRFLGSYFALVYFNLHSSYIVLFILIVAVTMIVKFDNYLRKFYHKLWNTENEISSKIYDVISNITTVIILRVERLMLNDIMKKVMSPFQLHMRTTKLSETKWMITFVMATIMLFSVLASYIYGAYIAGETIMIGTLSALYGYVNRINGLFFRFAYKYSQIVIQKTRVENVSHIVKAFKLKENVKTINVGSKWNELRLEHLTFNYQDKKGHDLHIKDMSLRIRRKEKIALVGESGSGKTTFLKLLRGLYKPSNIELYLDDRKIKNFDSIGRNIALIPQDPELFATTIRKNITMGVSHTKREIKKYTDMAKFTKVAERLPKKLESDIMEKGVNLSGGEKQRLALARGLMAVKDKPIVLLDEPTSSVDSKNELDIYKNVFSGYKSKTVISSIHRLHLLNLFDTIFLFDKGKIIAVGSFDELLKTSKKFKTLWQKYNKSKK